MLEVEEGFYWRKLVVRVERGVINREMLVWRLVWREVCGVELGVCGEGEDDGGGVVWSCVGFVLCGIFCGVMVILVMMWCYELN